MRHKRSPASAACEAVAVFLVTAAVFLLGVIVARAERGYSAIGGEYLLLQIFIDWAADIRKKVKRW